MKLLFKITLIVVITSGCFVKQKTVTKKYNYVLVKGNSKESPIVTGVIIAHENGKPFSFAAVKLNNEFLCRADIKGYFKCEFKPGSYRFGSTGAFMQLSETKKIKVENGDTLKINFYLFDGNQVMH